MTMIPVRYQTYRLGSWGCASVCCSTRECGRRDSYSLCSSASSCPAAIRIPERACGEALLDCPGVLPKRKFGRFPSQAQIRCRRRPVSRPKRGKLRRVEFDRGHLMAASGNQSQPSSSRRLGPRPWTLSWTLLWTGPQEPYAGPGPKRRLVTPYRSSSLGF